MMGDQPDDHVNEGEFDNEWEVKSESCWKPAGQGSQGNKPSNMSR